MSHPFLSHCLWMKFLAWHVAGGVFCVLCGGVLFGWCLVWLFVWLVCVVVLSWWLCLAFHPGLPSYKSYEAQDGHSEMGTRPDT